MYLFTLLISSPPSPSYSTSSFLLFHMTTWPSGLRRVTRNHFSSGGVGSNPAVVVFYTSFSIPFFPSSKKMVPPRFELGSREPESHMLPLHHGTFSSYIFRLPFTFIYFPFLPITLYIILSLPIPYLLLPTTLVFYFIISFPYMHVILLYNSIPFLTSPLFLLVKKRLPWVSNPRPYG